MARIRSVKPAFFTSEDVARVSVPARLLFIGLWTEADKDGRLVYRPRQLRARLFPYDDDLPVAELESYIDELSAAGLIVVYAAQVDDEPANLIAIPTWHDHQRPHPKEPASSLPGFGAEQKPKDRQAVVYFILDPAKRAIKIGVSTSPTNRLSSLQTGSAAKLELLGTAAGGFTVERDLHRRLASFRRHGEWFDDSPDVREAMHGACMTDASTMHPVVIPSSPARKGREGDLGREGKETPIGVSEADSAPSPKPKPYQHALVKKRDLSAFWEGPIFNLPGHWAAKALKASNGKATDADMVAFGRALTARLEREDGEAPAQNFLGWLDAEWAAYRQPADVSPYPKASDFIAKQDRMAAEAEAETERAKANGTYTDPAEIFAATRKRLAAVARG